MDASAWAQKLSCYLDCLRPVDKGDDVKLLPALLSLIIGVALATWVSPSFAWWQFVANSPSGERRVSPHFDSQNECKVALKATESRLAKKFPDLFPLVGSCEEYH